MSSSQVHGSSEIQSKINGTVHADESHGDGGAEGEVEGGGGGSWNRGKLSYVVGASRSDMIVVCVLLRGIDSWALFGSKLTEQPTD